MENILDKECFICQKGPSSNLRGTESGRTQLSKTLTELSKNLLIPPNLQWISSFPDSESFLKTLEEKNARYHHSCSNTYKSKYDRLIRKKENESNNELASLNVSSRPKRKHSSIFPFECIFCNEGEKDLSKMSKKDKNSEQLHAAGEWHTSSKIPNVGHMKTLTETWTEMATFLGDTNVLVKLDRDVRSNEIYYHGKCWKKFKYRYETLKAKENDDTSDNNFKRAVALGRTIALLRDFAHDNKDQPIEVRKLLKRYNKYLKEEGIEEKLTHVTRFGELILDHTNEFDIHSNSERVNVFILKDLYVRETSFHIPSNFGDSMNFLKDVRKAIKPIREIIDSMSFEFDKDEFDQVNCLPKELLALIGLLVEDNSSPTNPSQGVITLCHMIINLYRKKPKPKEENDKRVSLALHNPVYHETSLRNYITLKLYASFRSKELLQKFHPLGICSSYNRAVKIISDWASKSMETIRNSGKVIPNNLKRNTFTVFTKDNIDKNSSSNDAKHHFHGTSLCAFQPENYTDPISFENSFTSLDTSETAPDFTLPESYTKIPHVISKCEKYTCPISTINVPDDVLSTEVLITSRKEEINWIEAVVSTDIESRKCWSSYHAGEKRNITPPAWNKVIFPLFRNVVHTLDMQYHLISLCIDYTKTINPFQTTAVDCSDQPIFALSKINQWMFPKKFCMPKYFPLFGGLHIEKAILTANGNLIGGTGLKEILGDRNLDTIGISTASIDVNHIHKARYSVQLSVVAIYAALKDAHRKSTCSKSLMEWANDAAMSNIMFKYWLQIFNIQIDYLIFVRSLREGNFTLFVQVLASLVKWFFVFDQINYARWISIHLHDLQTLKVTCPVLFEQFTYGNFVVQVSNREFSQIHFDHAHEQCNKIIKSINGPINFVNRSDEDLQRKWEIVGPEVAEYIQKVEEIIFKPEESSLQRHHEDNPSHNETFLRESSIITKRLLPVNPFLEKEFVKLGTTVKFNEKVCEFAESIPTCGEEQYTTFVKERIVLGKLNVSDTIKKNDYETPLTTVKKQKKKTVKDKVKKLKDKEFIKLRAALAPRKEQCEDLFSEEFTNYPESLTKDGNIYQGSKSSILSVFDEGESVKKSIENTCVVIDLSSVIRSQAGVSNAETFSQFANDIINTLQNLLLGSEVTRLDIATDSYFQNSFKSYTRIKRGTGQYFPFEPSTLLPTDFKDDFLHNDRNKEALNMFLAKSILDADFGDVVIFISVNGEIMSNDYESENVISDLESTISQEEADTKIIPHIFSCLRNGDRHILVKTGDTDIIVLILAYFSFFDDPLEIEVDFGFGPSRRFYNINKISLNPQAEFRAGLLFFYIFTGSDFTSFFFSISKQTWWNLWMEHYHDVTDVFVKLSHRPASISEDDFVKLEKFVCRAYDQNQRFKTNDINSLRYLLFNVSTENNLRKLPPTRDALRLHILRSAFVAGWIWGQCLQGHDSIPDPTDWGYVLDIDDMPTPEWCPSPSILLKNVIYSCSCKNKCTGCKCVKDLGSCLPHCKCPCNN